MNNWFTTLFDKEREMAWQSTVITDWKKCYKLYELSQEDIKAYTNQQNQLSWKTYEIDFTNWLDIWQLDRIKKIKVNFLNVNSEIYQWCDIKTKRNINITEVPFIDWDTLTNYWEKNSYRNSDYYKFIPLLHRIREIIEQELWLDMSLQDETLRTQLNLQNIKIEYIEWEEMWIIITDICSEIDTFLEKNSSQIQRILKNIIVKK